MTAVQYEDAMKRDSFISGISSSPIRQRLLESRTLTFSEAYEEARALELVKLTSDCYLAGETMTDAGRVFAVNKSHASDFESRPNFSDDRTSDASQNCTSNSIS